MLFLIAHNIRSLYNVGSMFRNADAFGVDHLFLTGYTGTPPRPEIAKVSLGAEDTVPWSHTRDPLEVIERLRSDRVRILAFESHPSFVPLTEFVVEPSASYAVLVGNEPEGLDTELMAHASERLIIPMYGAKSSLNVAVASGIALYHLKAK